MKDKPKNKQKPTFMKIYGIILLISLMLNGIITILNTTTVMNQKNNVDELLKEKPIKTISTYESKLNMIWIVPDVKNINTSRELKAYDYNLIKNKNNRIQLISVHKNLPNYEFTTDAIRISDDKMILNIISKTTTNWKKETRNNQIWYIWSDK